MTILRKENDRRQCAVIMYHYVRNLKDSAWPALKSLSDREFADQLEWLSRHGSLISPDALFHGEDLPPRSVLLTFDDGYIDHYRTVFPMLRERGIAGVFAPVVSAVRGTLLDVNKIHFILASAQDEHELVRRIDAFILEHREALGFIGAEYRRTMVKRGLDTVAVSFIKDMLQKRLPPDMRQELSAQLFSEYVSRDEVDFASSLYMTPSQLREMHEDGMFLSVHGLTHNWFTSFKRDQLQHELAESLAFFDSLDVPRNRLSITWPYGAWTDDALHMAHEAGLRLGFATRSGVAECGADADAMLTLPRIDARDVPTNSGNAYGTTPGMAALQDFVGLQPRIIQR